LHVPNTLFFSFFLLFCFFFIIILQTLVHATVKAAGTSASCVSDFGISGCC
jgi:hypothetical protein